MSERLTEAAPHRRAATESVGLRRTTTGPRWTCHTGRDPTTDDGNELTAENWTVLNLAVSSRAVREVRP